MARGPENQNPPIRLTERGQWLHGDVPLHPRVAALFARSIVPKSDGGYFIELRGDKEPLEAEDAAFFVESMQIRTGPKGAPAEVRLRLSDGREEALAPSTLMISEENVLYARVLRHGLWVPCRFPPSLYHQLALHVEEEEGVFVLPVGGVSYPIEPYDPRPLASCP